MSAWLKTIDLDSSVVTVTPLNEDRLFPGGTLLTRTGALRLNGQPPRALQHGDTFAANQALNVFLTRPTHDNPSLIANLDERPDDDTAIKVWADWLLEHGDPLGEHLLIPEPQPWVLEGLATPALELTWSHGLIVAATLRSTPTSGRAVETLMRLRATRVFRWVRALTVDCAAWGTNLDEVQMMTARVLRGLIEGSPLPALRSLRFGVNTAPFASTELLSRLTARLPTRFPSLATDPATLIKPAQVVVLEIVKLPDGLDFHAPDARNALLPLTRGAWAGSSTPGQLRLLSQGVHRGGVMESFLIERAGDQISLFPVENVLLNGRSAIQTRLLDGDLIEEPRGAVFRFRAD